MLNDLLLLSGNDIPFPAAHLVIHQPTLKEIAYIGEEAFYSGCEMLKISKDRFKEEDKNHLEQLTNFDILMSIILTDDVNIQQKKLYILMVLSLIFPQLTISFNSSCILLKDNEGQEFKIDNSNFEEFKQILDEMFCLTVGDKDGEGREYNPQDPLAERIARKLNARKQKLNEIKSMNPEKIAILSRFVSVLAIGQKQDINSFLNYTVYQIFDTFNRYELKMNYDIYLQAKMAGAKDLKEVEDWMKDIHP